MELLPVIYWSLFSVGILALVVIIISFITFKFRKKYGSIPSDEVVGKERNKKVKVTNPDKKSKTEVKHHPKVQTKSKQKSTSKQQNTEQPPSSDNGFYKKPSPESQKKRIEILNPSLNKSSSSKNSSDNKDKFHSLKVNTKHNDWK